MSDNIQVSKPTMPMQNRVGGYFYPLTSGDQVIINDNQKLGNLFDLIYPVGSIYMSMNDIDPSVLFGGTWEQIKDKFLLSAGDSYVGGTTGGAKSVRYTPEGSNTGTSLSVAQMPAHTHTRGNMDITGNFPASLEGSGTFHTTGAFALASEKKYFGWGQEGKDYDNYGINFTASRNWTGETSSVGSGQSHTHTFNGTAAIINTMPPYYAVYIWKRIG